METLVTSASPGGGWKLEREHFAGSAACGWLPVQAVALNSVSIPSREVMGCAADAQKQPDKGPPRILGLPVPFVGTGREHLNSSLH